MTAFLKKNEKEIVSLFLSSIPNPAQEESRTNTCANKCILSLGEILLKITDWFPSDFLFLMPYFKNYWHYKGAEMILCSFFML